MEAATPKSTCSKINERKPMMNNIHPTIEKQQYGEIVRRILAPGLFLEFQKCEQETCSLNDRNLPCKLVLENVYCQAGGIIYNSAEDKSPLLLWQSQCMACPYCKKGVCTLPFGFYRGTFTFYKCRQHLRLFEIQKTL